jgi:hypothetical protein
MPPGTSVVGGASGAGGLPPLEEIEVTMRFEDRRSVDGLLLPLHVVTEARGVLLADLRFDEISVNQPLTERDFDIRR